MRSFSFTRSIEASTLPSSAAAVVVHTYSTAPSTMMKAKTNSGPFKEVTDAVRLDKDYWLLTLDTDGLKEHFPRLKVCCRLVVAP